MALCFPSENILQEITAKRNLSCTHGWDRPNKYYCQGSARVTSLYFVQVYIYISGMELRMLASEGQRLTEGHLNVPHQQMWWSKLWPLGFFYGKISQHPPKKEKNPNLKGFKNKLKTPVKYFSVKVVQKYCFHSHVDTLNSHIQTVLSALQGSNCLFTPGYHHHITLTCKVRAHNIFSLKNPPTDQFSVSLQPFYW